MPKPYVFHLHFNRFGQKRGEKVWTVHQNGKCRQFKSVCVNVPVTTVYLGDSAQQPRAYLRGIGIVTVKGGRVTIN